MFDCDDLFSSKELQRIFGGSRKIQACSTPISEARRYFETSSGSGQKTLSVKCDHGGSKEAKLMLEKAVKTGSPAKARKQSKEEMKEKSQKPTTSVPDPKLKIRRQKGSPRIQHKESEHRTDSNSKKSQDLKEFKQSSSGLSAQRIGKSPPPNAPTNSPPIAAKRFALEQRVPSTPQPSTKAYSFNSIEALRIKALYNLLLQKCTPGPDPLTLLPYKKCSI